MIEEKGQLVDIGKSFTNKIRLTFEFEDFPKTAIDSLSGDLRIGIKKWKESRSKNANALLWLCIGEIAKATRLDKWDVYLRLLRDSGQFTYICVKPASVPKIKKQWRLCEEIGDIMIGGERATQLLCYYGSHTYDTEEFSILLDGVMQEMKDLHIPMPSDERARQYLKEWESFKNGKKDLQHIDR